MERRVTSHTEEEEMNQRRRLLTLARKGDQKAIDLLFELYQVRVFSGDALKTKKLPSLPVPKLAGTATKGSGKGAKKKEKQDKAPAGKSPPSKVVKKTEQAAGKGPKPTKKPQQKPKVVQKGVKKTAISGSSVSKKKALKGKIQAKKKTSAGKKTGKGKAAKPVMGTKTRKAKKK